MTALEGVVFITSSVSCRLWLEVSGTVASESAGASLLAPVAKPFTASGVTEGADTSFSGASMPEINVGEYCTSSSGGVKRSSSVSLSVNCSATPPDVQLPASISIMAELAT